jgi:hypothetical protein
VSKARNHCSASWAVRSWTHRFQLPSSENTKALWAGIARRIHSLSRTLCRVETPSDGYDGRKGSEDCDDEANLVCPESPEHQSEDAPAKEFEREIVSDGELLPRRITLQRGATLGARVCTLNHHAL